MSRESCQLRRENQTLSRHYLPLPATLVRPPFEGPRVRSKTKKLSRRAMSV